MTNYIFLVIFFITNIHANKTGITYRQISKIKSIATASEKHSGTTSFGNVILELISSKLIKRQCVYCSFIPVSPLTYINN